MTMRTSNILLPLLILFSLLLLTHSTLSNDDEDLSFLDDPTTDPPSSGSDPESDWADSDDVPDFGSAEYDDEDDPNSLPAVDEKDVVVLTEANFSSFVAKTKHAMVEFYAPWCGHCQALAPEYAAAATDLREEKVDVVLAKVDATEDEELSGKFEVQGFPTVLFFVDGVHKTYNGQRTKDAIMTWIKKKIGPGIQNITTLDEAETILTTQTKLALAFLEDLVGPNSEELASASKLEDDVNFYQTVNPEVAKLFHIDTNSKRPSLVMLKKENEKISYFDGQFQKIAIAEFVAANKIPLVTYFTRESAPLIFENPIKNQVLLFATSNQSEKVLPLFQEAAKSFKGKLIFVYVERDNEDVGVPVSDYFGITGDDPKILGYTGNEDGKKYIFDGELTLENIKVFAEDFLQDKLKPFYKSDPLPETNDGDVKIVVGNNFDDIVLDESKDVLLEIFAPWCGHCQALEPIYNKLAKHLNGIDSLIIAKMDGTTNEHPRAKADGFPTLLFFPAGNKSFEPVTVETDRTVVALYKFIKKHAAIPFKLQKPASEAKPEATDATPSGTDTSDNLKDEL